VKRVAAASSVGKTQLVPLTSERDATLCGTRLWKNEKPKNGNLKRPTKERATMTAAIKLPTEKRITLASLAREIFAECEDVRRSCRL
jgi:hypothetical protein